MEIPERQADQGREISVLGLVRIIRRWRNPFAVLAIGLPFITIVIMLFTANKFTATGTILVETPEGGLGSDLMGQIRSITGFAPQVPPTEMYMAILRSERVGIAVAESLDLPTHYEIDADTPGEAMEQTLEIMSKKIEFKSPDLVSIQIAATDPDPQKAADIVNAFLHELEVANQTLALSRARKTRRLVGESLSQTAAESDSTRKTMQAFQERFGVISIEKQTEGTLELIRTLQAELLATQTQRDQLGGFTSEGSSRLQNLDLKIQALRAQINQLVIGESKAVVMNSEADAEPGPRSKAVESFFIPLGQLPHLASEYSRIFMDLAVQQEKYRVLATQLEQTKIEESQSIPSFEILDWGRRPYRKSGPFRTLITLASMVGGVLSGVLLAVLLDDLNQRVDRETRSELLALLPERLRRRFRMG